ncbi:MAG: PIN domain-containing protein [Oscillospiraceae bacterium]|jgi:hypothetical protein|nr:PIN domain-containing protein [Oscillospiraceae bacterium]
MRIFLIDFENVHSEGMTGVDHLTEMDEVVIFYSSNADSVTFDILHKLMFCKSKLTYYKIKRGGKNALDFQLSCYLGFRIRKDPDAEFYIISRDNGYDFISDFWECGYLGIEPEIKRFSTIKLLLQWVETQKKQKEKVLTTLEKLAVGDAHPGVPNAHPDAPEPDVPSTNGRTESSDPTTEYTPTLEDAQAAAELMAASKKAKRNSHGLYIDMVKKFGQKKGRELYSFYKNDYKSKDKPKTK